MRYIYVDETFFGKNNEFAGCGILVTDKEITESVIKEALDNLKKELHSIDNSLDKKTLKNAHFHACEDSKNSHSHLAKSINKNINGEFHAWLDKRSGNKNEFFEHLTYAILRNLNHPEPIKIIFEQREDLTRDKIENWLNKITEETFLLENHLHYLWPYYYPEITYDEAGTKKTPGLQCVDLILWSAQRRYLSLMGGKQDNKDEYCKFFKGSNPKHNMRNLSSAEGRSTDKDENYRSYYLSINKGIELKDHFFYDERIKKIEDIDRTVKLSDVIIGVQKIINTAHTINSSNGSKNNLFYIEDINGAGEFSSEAKIRLQKIYTAVHTKNKIFHLSNEVKIAYESRFLKGPTNLIWLAKVFIKLFDMMPIISNESSLEEKKYWLYCRGIMRRIINQNNLSNIDLMMLLNDVRANIIDDHTEHLNSAY